MSCLLIAIKFRLNGFQICGVTLVKLINIRQRVAIVRTRTSFCVCQEAVCAGNTKHYTLNFEQEAVLSLPLCVCVWPPTGTKLAEMMT